MKMGVGVEWGLHCCLSLAWVGPEHAVTIARLASFHGLPPTYLNKQLQLLAGDGIIVSSTGPRGGFRLARRAEQITVMDIVAALEGREELFRCTEIRQQEPGSAPADVPQAPCAITQIMRQAEFAWREVLAGQTIADIMTSVERLHPGLPERVRRSLVGLAA